MSCVLVCPLNNSTTATAHEGMQCLEHSCISLLTVALVHMQAGGSHGDETIAGSGRIPDHVTRSMYGCPSDIGNQNIRQNIAIYPAAEDMQSSEQPPDSGITVLLDSCTIAAAFGMYA